jgi:CMP-N,N'-diacetyllegionaminic acid synthase
MKFLIVIPARSDSKSINKKNTYIINKKPLVQYTFETIKKFLPKNKFLLSDDNKIKKLAKKFNIKTNYKRPKKVSKNTSLLSDTLLHFHRWTESKKIFYDYIVVLQPTSPLRSYEDINRAINLVKQKRYKSLFSISKSLEHPYETIKIKKNNTWDYVLKKSKFYFRRQDFDFESYFINGAIYIINRELVIKKKIFNKEKHGFLVMSKYNSIDINDLSEIEIAKQLLKRK